MDQLVAPPLDPQLFNDNLAALRRVDGDLAARIEQAERDLPVFAPARARDGLLNLQLTDAQGGVSWFGRTSIPSVRAEALLGRFEVGSSNVLLPGIGQGLEITLLLQRLGKHRAVFVWETVLADLALAMRLHDWAGAIADGRCVFIVCPPDQLAAALVDWLDRHPGHLCPERIMMWPWSALQDLAACRTAVQTAYDETERRRSAALAQENADYPVALENAPAGLASAFASGPLPVFTLLAHEDVHLLADQIVVAASNAQLPSASIPIRLPGDIHPLARLRSLRRLFLTPPTGAILLDCSRDQLRGILPDTAQAVTWLGPAAAPLPMLVGGVGRSDVLVATSSRLRDRILAAGWDRPAPPVVPYPCAVAPEDFTDPTGERSMDVLLVADAFSIEPEPYGFHLHTQGQIWRTACDLIKARIESFTEDQASSIFARAETKLGFQAAEATVRKAMLESLGTSVANSFLGSFLAQVLSENKVDFRILGQGWGATAFAARVIAASTPRESRQAFRGAKLVILADVTGENSGTALTAAACGAAVVWRKHPLDSQPGGVATLLARGEEVVAYHYAREMAVSVRQLLASTGERRRIVTAAQAKCLAVHMPKARLDALRIATSSYLSVVKGQP